MKIYSYQRTTLVILAGLMSPMVEAVGMCDSLEYAEIRDMSEKELVATYCSYAAYTKISQTFVDTMQKQMKSAVADRDITVETTQKISNALDKGIEEVRECNVQQ